MKYDILKTNELPIGIFITPPKQLRNEEQYSYLKESGINFIISCKNHENSAEAIITSLNLAKEKEIKFFVLSKTEDLIQNSKENIDKSDLNNYIDSIKIYSKNSAYIGECLAQKPEKKNFNIINEVILAYKKNFPSKLWHIDMQQPIVDKVDEYENYMDLWFNIVKPHSYSFENCTIKSEKDISVFFYYYDMVREKTYKKRIPFWSIINITNYIDDKKGNIENVREYIRWQVYIALAFGAKGLQYNSFYATDSKKTDGITVIDEDGKKNAVYEYIKDLNIGIKEIGKVLLNCDAEGVIINNGSLYSKPLRNFYPVISIDGDDTLTGCFTDNNGNKKILITNTSYLKDTNITVKVNDSVKMVNVYIGTSKFALSPKNNMLNVNINAGDAVFIEF